MTLEEIQQHWDRDSEVDRTELGNEATKIPQLHSKYFKMFSTERLKLKQMEGKAKVLHLDLWTYYQGLGLSYQKEKVDFLEAIIKSLNARGFNINAAISWEKFKVGI